MKRFNWVLIGVMISVLAIVLLAGCVSKSEFEVLQAEHATLMQEKASLTAELQQAQSDLTNAQANYDVVKADQDALKADYGELNANYEAANKELAEIKEVYPPRDFSSLSELRDWLLENDVSERPITQYGEEWYRKALEIQEDALKDGYIVSADYDVVDEGISVWCTAIVNGRLFFWDPETDEVTEESSLGTVKQNYDNGSFDF